MSEVKTIAILSVFGKETALIDRAHFDRVTAERDALQTSLDAVTFNLDKTDKVVLDLQQRLSAADERADLLEGLVRDAQKAFNYDPAGSCYNPGIAFVKPWSIRAVAALKPAEVGSDE